MYSVDYIRTLLAFSLIAVTTPSEMLQTGTSGIISSASTTVKRVEAIVGGEADLLCDTRPPTINDSLMLVVWYRDDNPVYSYDTRLSTTSAHWVDEPYIRRTLWHNVPSTGLHIRNIQARDRATYRCRVDFYVSPTRNYKVALDVVELPSKPVIFDDTGRQISGSAGPYYEGSEFKLICVVTGGYPMPRIQWLQGDTVLSILNAGEITSPARSITLTVKNASRAHLSVMYTCSTDNTLLVSPRKTSVKVDMYLKPLSIDITSREQPLSVGTKAEFSCKTTGSRPPAIITWWLDNQKMTGSMNKPGIKETNETESLLQWIPSKEHNGKVLACRAENPNFNHSYIDKKLTLDVYYMPEAAIRFGAKINPNDIEEGDDVYFHCEVNANPPAYKVVWEHNGVLIQHKPMHGVVVGNTNLALQKVSRHQAGSYTCTASNVEGDGKSSELKMQVIYRPLCQMKHLKIIGAIIQEPTKVVCEVDAFPPPDIFEWTLNNSAGAIKLNRESFTVNSRDGKSILTYTPTSEADYGTLLCRATNMAGPQMSPCIYTLLPARRPEPLSNCSVNNLTDNSLDLLCSPGYDGGLQCVYVVEVWSDERLVVNASSDGAIWSLRKLGANRRLQLIVYATNAKGRSEHVTLAVETLKLLPKTEPEQLWEMGWTTGVLLGAALTITTVTLSLAVITTRTRFRSRDFEVTLAAMKNQKVITRNPSRSTEDKNPDVIPFSKDTPPDPPLYSTIAAIKNSKSTHSLQYTETILAPKSEVTQRDPRMTNGALISQREIVTTRTPLVAEHQESCV